ncbi:MAG: hypothetical protein ABJQ29_02620 [Luteolibacter sp.]
MERIRNIDAWRRWMWVACALLAGFVFICSWLPKPQLAAQIPMPHLLARWVDAPANQNLRTAVPFALLGFVSSYLLWMRSAPVLLWITGWLTMIALAGAAEIGQCFIPSRCCDLADVGWAAAGAATGLFLIPLAALTWRFTKEFRTES